jgi:histidinol-phosphate aminotransferase
MSDAVTESNKVIYLANPNNPTGTMFKAREFESFMHSVPNTIPVILDEAYTLFAEGHPGYPNGLDYDYPNLIVTRTFSKAYGLAGLRVGFAVSHPDIIKELYKVKLPFEPNLTAQIAAAAALDDDDFLVRTKETNTKSLQRFRKFFEELGIKQIPTAANFILMLFPTEQIAAAFNEECQNNGLIVRFVKPFGIPNGIRINSGTVDETEFAIKVIGKVYDELLARFNIETRHTFTVRI